MTAAALSNDALFKRLSTLIKDWNEFDLVPDEQKEEAKQIGELLYKQGGHQLMMDGYYHVKQQNRCASVLQAFWDGIGVWQW